VSTWSFEALVNSKVISWLFENFQYGNSFEITKYMLDLFDIYKKECFVFNFNVRPFQLIVLRYTMIISRYPDIVLHVY
jgi:hypothetical protein